MRVTLHKDRAHVSLASKEVHLLNDDLNNMKEKFPHLMTRELKNLQREIGKALEDQEKIPVCTEYYHG